MTLCIPVSAGETAAQLHQQITTGQFMGSHTRKVDLAWLHSTVVSSQVSIVPFNCLKKCVQGTRLINIIPVSSSPPSHPCWERGYAEDSNVT